MFVIRGPISTEETLKLAAFTAKYFACVNNQQFIVLFDDRTILESAKYLKRILSDPWTPSDLIDLTDVLSWYSVLEGEGHRIDAVANNRDEIRFADDGGIHDIRSTTEPVYIFLLIKFTQLISMENDSIDEWFLATFCTRNEAFVHVSHAISQNVPRNIVLASQALRGGQT
jgi:hypothetical protein